MENVKYIYGISDITHRQWRGLSRVGQPLATHKSEMSVGNKKSSKNGQIGSEWFRLEEFPFQFISFELMIDVDSQYP